MKRLWHKLQARRARARLHRLLDRYSEPSMADWYTEGGYSRTVRALEDHRGALERLGRGASFEAAVARLLALFGLALLALAYAAMSPGVGLIGGSFLSASILVAVVTGGAK